MITNHTPGSLKAFEQRVAEAFNAGKIRAPVHLSGGNEHELIEIFRQVRSDDWVCGAWRMHYQCLLKGVPEDKLFDDIVAGKSIALCYPEYRVISSAIVGGILPIAVGLAMAIVRKAREAPLRQATPSVSPEPREPVVWAFCGDMTARTGIYHECLQYAVGHSLPIRFVTEDNRKSVCTPTADVWGHGHAFPLESRYRYELPWPHAGAGKRVQF